MVACLSSCVLVASDFSSGGHFAKVSSFALSFALSSLDAFAVPAAIAAGSLFVFSGVCSAGFLFSAPVQAPDSVSYTHLTLPTKA